MNPEKRLTLSQTDRKLCGVCGGIAEYFGIDSSLIRVLFLILFFMYGVGFLAYLCMALVIPSKSDL